MLKKIGERNSFILSLLLIGIILVVVSACDDAPILKVPLNPCSVSLGFPDGGGDGSPMVVKYSPQRRPLLAPLLCGDGGGWFLPNEECTHFGGVCRNDPLIEGDENNPASGETPIRCLKRGYEYVFECPDDQACYIPAGDPNGLCGSDQPGMNCFCICDATCHDYEYWRGLGDHNPDTHGYETEEEGNPGYSPGDCPDPETPADPEFCPEVEEPYCGNGIIEGVGENREECDIDLNSYVVYHTLEDIGLYEDPDFIGHFTNYDISACGLRGACDMYTDPCTCADTHAQDNQVTADTDVGNIMEFADIPPNLCLPSEYQTQTACESVGGSENHCHWREGFCGGEGLISECCCDLGTCEEPSLCGYYSGCIQNDNCQWYSARCIVANEWSGWGNWYASGTWWTFDNALRLGPNNPEMSFEISDYIANDFGGVYGPLEIRANEHQYAVSG